MTSEYEAQRDDTPEMPQAFGNSAQLNEFIEVLHDAKSMPIRQLLRIWRQIDQTDARLEAASYVQISQRFLRFGEPILAYDILKKGLRSHPGHSRMRQLLGLALARSGAPHAAARRLEKLRDEGHDDEETLGILARAYKDLWSLESNAELRDEYLKKSLELYRTGFELAVSEERLDGALYTGVNLATLQFLSGDRESAGEMARQVAEICKQRLEQSPDYWALATLGECNLIQGDFDRAESDYRSAVKLAGDSFADIGSTKRNAVILLEHMGENLDRLEQWFPIPRVAIFTGHLMDRPGQPLRFPHTEIESVRSQLSDLIRKQKIGFGYSAAAGGSDLLFVDALHEHQAQSTIILPLNRDAFVEASVANDRNFDWTPEFENALNRATQVWVVNDFSHTASPLHFAYANLVMTGLAILQSRMLGTQLVPIAVWDGKPARGIGGTGSLVALWKSLGWQPNVVAPIGNPQTANRSVPPDDQHSVQPPPPVETISSIEPANGSETPQTSDDSGFRQEICALLFADVVGYSSISEEEIPFFVSDFMGSIAQTVKESGIEIQSENTWGDAIYFVFRSVDEAGQVALRITEHVNSIDWRTKGFQRQLNLRTGLHVGPVYRVTDPVTGNVTHTGAHVSRAARIEPISPPGEVYASQSFAAIAAAENITSFQCDYVGVTPMAKGYGEFPTYHVRRRRL